MECLPDLSLSLSRVVQDFEPEGRPTELEAATQAVENDASLPLTKSKRIDLGLDLLSIFEPGTPHTLEEIAAWCDCSVQAVALMERKALNKLRRALRKVGMERTELKNGL